MLSHANVVAAISAVLLQLGDYKPISSDLMISYLPLAYMLERCCQVINSFFLMYSTTITKTINHSSYPESVKVLSYKFCYIVEWNVPSWRKSGIFQRKYEIFDRRLENFKTHSHASGAATAESYLRKRNDQHSPIVHKTFLFQCRHER